MQSETTVYVQPKYEPRPIMSFSVGPFMALAWMRPFDVSIGFQIVGGGILISVWPVAIGLVHINRAEQYFRRADDAE